jgi:DNA mismatch repair protein MutS2
MFQSGLFLSIDERSSCCWFEQVLSDIGDNQSIENQLSTYSYRLNRMQYFLTHANEKTLLLLDEFGSGSDPELGGALAEVFYEELYAKAVFAVITTHYTNIKILTATLPQATNACMLFDTKKLSPLYQLSIGQPGSSFTFEVAQHNGIPLSLIERAKGLVSENKVKVEGLTVALQQEKSKFKKINDQQYKSNTKAIRAIQEYEKKLEKLTLKADKQNLFFEQQNKFITTGKKVFELIKKFKHHKTDKALTEALRKMAAIEKNKILESDKPIVFDKNLKQPDLPEQKNKSSKDVIVTKKIEIESIKIGDLVKLKNQSKKATVTEIKGKKLTVQLGNFTIKTSVDELEP